MIGRSRWRWRLLPELAASRIYCQDKIRLFRQFNNPMYVSVLTILIGEAIFFMSTAIIIEAGIFMVLVYLFVVFYEEPTLRRQFGESYDEYTQKVSRWIPRLKRK